VSLELEGMPTRFSVSASSCDFTRKSKEESADRDGEKFTSMSQGNRASSSMTSKPKSW
jgi:hypothetical protein